MQNVSESGDDSIFAYRVYIIIIYSSNAVLLSFECQHGRAETGIEFL